MKATTKKRIELIDLAKALTIFLVILGHTASIEEAPLYARIIYTFHMPLFFFLAGLSIKPAAIRGWKDCGTFLKKNVQAIVVPFLIWGLIYAPFSFQNIPYLLYASWASLGKMGTLTSLWYLAALFLARLMVQAILNLLCRKEWKHPEIPIGLSAIPMFLVGFLLPHLETGYFWCLDIAFVASGFILAGIALRKPLLILAQQKVLVLIAVFIVSLGVLFCGTVLRGDALVFSLMCDSQYGNIFFFMLNSVAGSMALLGLCMLLIRVAREGVRPFAITPITYLGKQTMGIFLLHKNLLQMLIMPWLLGLLPKAPLFPVALLGSLITLAICIVLCFIIERFVPQLLGQFPRYEK